MEKIHVKEKNEYIIAVAIYIQRERERERFERIFTCISDDNVFEKVSVRHYQ